MDYLDWKVEKIFKLCLKAEKRREDPLGAYDAMYQGGKEDAYKKVIDLYELNEEYEKWRLKNK